MQVLDLTEEQIAFTIVKTYKDTPYNYVIDIIGVIPDPQQKQILIAIQDGARFIAVKSGHGVGKTALEAWLIQWFLVTRPHCKIPSTAPTSLQLLSNLWPEIFKWSQKSKLKSWFDRTKTMFFIKGFEEDWFAIARSSNKPENLHGFHADNLLYNIEEASGVPQDIMEVVEGALTSKDNYCFMFSNPTKLSGTFYNAFHKDKKNWVTFTLNSEESSLVEKSYCERMASKFGRNSDVYRVRVLGEFPRGETEAIFTIDEVEEAMRRELTEPTVMIVYLGVDVARFGDNKTVIAKRRGLKIEILNKFYKQDTMATTGNIVIHIKQLEREGFEVIVNIDDTGVGGGVTDRLRELESQGEFNASILAVNNGATAFDKAHYANKGTELWMLLKEGIKDYKLPDDEDLVGELTTRKKIIESNGSVRLQSKKDITTKGRLSPDTADAITLTLNDGEDIKMLEDPNNVMGLF